MTAVQQGHSSSSH